MTFRYHGNWCGPGWSDGKYVSSRNGFAPAVDEFDESCRQHDFALVGGARDRAADARFYEENVGKGLKRSFAALAVKARDLAQTLSDPPPSQNLPSINKMTKTSKAKNLRGGPTPKSKTVRPVTMRDNDSTRAAPVAIATRRTGAAPKISTTSSGVVINHRSFLFPVTNSINFSVTSVPCNPGLSGSFPWLGKLARRYEQYRFLKLKYSFRSVASSATTGVVMMSFDYDAADTAPATKAEQAQTVPNSETNVWMNNDLIVRPDNSWHFIRAGTLASNLDVKTYDMGNLWLSSVYGDGVVGGELYVEYSVELRRPTDGPEVCGKLTTASSNFASPFPSNTLSISGAAFPFTRTTDTELTVTAGGEYLISAVASGSVLSSAFPVPTIVSASPTSVAASVEFFNSANKSIRMVRVRVETGDSIVFANAGTGTTLTGTVLYVSSIDYASF